MVDLRSLDPGALEPLLAEETAEWRSRLDWDFSRIAGLVRSQLDARKLNGAALLDRGEVAGCGYLGIESAKGLIVDVYIRTPWRDSRAEELLFRVLLNALIATPGIRRVESQLMLAMSMHDSPARSYDRLLMARTAREPLPANRASIAQRFRIERWSDRLREPAAEVLAAAHAGHIDCRISDQYLSLAGCARLIDNILRMQIADTFCSRASFVAFDEAETEGAPAGLLLASLVADRVGHITEVCVTPEAQGGGLGYELLRLSIASLREAGADRVTLTVTEQNSKAVELYVGCGFREMRRFPAYVWERP